jgi:hypothetical protein
MVSKRAAQGAATSDSAHENSTRRKSSRQESFIPGEWDAWKGLAAPGLWGSAAELLLDEIMDIHDELTEHVEQLRPRCVTAMPHSPLACPMSFVWGPLSTTVYSCDS